MYMVVRVHDHALHTRKLPITYLVDYVRVYQKP
jgi:hypothetical protein